MRTLIFRTAAPFLTALMLLFSVFVILVLLFRPQGLFPRRLRAYVARWGRS